MVGDREVLVSVGPGGSHHLFERADAVGQVGMRVQVAPNIGGLNDVRQTTAERGLHLGRCFSRMGGGTQSMPRRR